MPISDKELDQFVLWKNEYRAQSENMTNDIHYVMEQTPEQRKKAEYARSVINNVDKDSLKKSADQFIAQQKLDKVGSIYNPSEKLEKIKQAAKIKGVEIGTFDLDFLIADSLQKMDAREDPHAEYYDWVEAQQHIERSLYSGGATQQEIDIRDGFIDFLTHRESEMRRIMSLYAGAAIYGNGAMKDAATERLAFMNFKLSELRRLRTRMQATKGRADNKEKDKKEEEERIAKEKREQEAREKFSAEIIEGALTIGAMATAHDIMMQRYLKIKSGVDSYEFEHGLAQELVKFRPVTETLEQAENKIKNTRSNSNRMARMITAMRMGVSKANFDDDDDENEDHEIYCQQTNCRKGFDVVKYKNLSEMSRTA